MKLVNLSVKRPVGVIMIVFAIIALGFMSFRNLAVDLYPEIDLPIAAIATSYPGAGSEEVEESISKPIEDAVSTIEGLDTLQSQSQPNSSLVIMQFTTSTEIDQALLDVREKVDQVKGMLPEDANDPSVLRFDPQQIPVMYLSLTGDRPEKLEQIAEDEIQPFLERAEGVASVSIEGGKTREIQVLLDQAQLRKYNLTVNQVIQALNSNNQTGSGGAIQKGHKDLQITIDGEFQTLDDIRKTVVPLARGGVIKVQDIATIKDTFKEVTSITRVNNEPALVFSVMKQSDANTIEVADEVYDAMEGIKERLPENLEFTVVFDTSTFIRDAIASVSQNMVVGGILAMGILLLFLRSVRTTVVIGVSIPIALVATFTLMYFTGQTVNILSMGGLALGIGMMVDNAIVILENIVQYRQRGSSMKEAAIKGGSELGGAVIASTTTSLVVFLPITFVEGMASDLFTPLALTVSYSLFASLIVALTLIPMLSSKLLRKSIKPPEEQKGLFNRFFNRIAKTYKSLLQWVLNHRKTTVFVTIAALVGSLTLAPMIGTSFVPASDQGQLEITVETDSGSSLEETVSVTDEISERLTEFEDVIKVNFLSVASDAQTGLASTSNKATFTIQLIDAEQRNVTTQEMVEKMREAVSDVAGAEIVVGEMEQGLGTGAPIQVNISGTEQEVLEELSQQVVWTISDIEGVVNPESSSSSRQPEINVDIDRNIAAQYGLNYQQIMNQVNVGMTGQVATLFRVNGNEFDVRVMLPKEKRTSISDLEQLLIQTPTGEFITLSTVADLEQVQGPVTINRENQQRQINVTAEVEGRDLGSVVGDIKTELASMNFPEGYHYSMGGQSEDMAESFRNLAIALVFSIFLVYAVMAVQFESFMNPFIIMFSLPTILVGILVGLFITGEPFSLPAFIGIIMLAGIVVNNAIVLVDYINILREQGKSRTEAILEAGPSRLRPILMTTLTTVLGMIPLALGIGEGSEAQTPMAVVIIFGLSTSTLFTLLLIPVMYTYLEDFAKFVKRIFTRKSKKKMEDDGVTHSF